MENWRNLRVWAAIFLVVSIIVGIAHASLAGGVAIGASVANVTPGWSMLIGTVAGAISVVRLQVYSA